MPSFDTACLADCPACLAEQRAALEAPKHGEPVMAAAPAGSSERLAQLERVGVPVDLEAEALAQRSRSER